MIFDIIIYDCIYNWK